MIFQRSTTGRSFRIAYRASSPVVSARLPPANDQDNQDSREDQGERRNWAVVLVLSVPVFAVGCLLLVFL